MLAHWKTALGTDRITVRRIIEKATRQVADGYGNTSREFEHPDFREALMAVAGQGGVINGRRLGKWLGRKQAGSSAACRSNKAGWSTTSAMSWRVVDRTKKSSAAQADALQEEEADRDVPF